MTSRFPPFAFVHLVSPYNKKNITRRLEDMNIKFISSSHRVISSIYFNLTSILISGRIALLLKVRISYEGANVKYVLNEES